MPRGEHQLRSKFFEKRPFLPKNVENSAFNCFLSTRLGSLSIIYAGQLFSCCFQSRLCSYQRWGEKKEKLRTIGTVPEMRGSRGFHLPQYDSTTFFSRVFCGAGGTASTFLVFWGISWILTPPPITAIHFRPCLGTGNV